MRRLLESFVAGIVLVLLAGCGSSSTTTGATSTANVVITIVSENGAMSFSPASATAKVGQTVAWTNSDTLTHTATEDNGTFDTGGVNPGTASAPIAMPKAGTFPYHCSIHPTMTGTLTITQ